MCGRYSITEDLDVIIDQLNVDLPDFDFEPRYNIAPSQRLPVITNEAPGQLALHKWGLVPFWAKDPKIGYKLINARGETIAQKPSFREATKKRRCLIPADGFYEWKKTATGKQPHHIRLKSREVMTLGGLWETWKDAEGKEMRTFTIITTTPNEMMEDLHDRMPVIIPPEDRQQWLEGSVEEALALVKPYPSAPMEAVRVSTRVNSPRNEGPELLEPDTLF